MHFVLPGSLPELYGGYFNLQKIEAVLLFLFMTDEMALIFLRMAVSFSLEEAECVSIDKMFWKYL